MKCRICHDTGKLHEGRCPKFIGAMGPCSCAHLTPCFMCQADKRDLWKLVILVLTITAIIAWVLLMTGCQSVQNPDYIGLHVGLKTTGIVGDYVGIGFDCDFGEGRYREEAAAADDDPLGLWVPDYGEERDPSGL